MSEAAGSAAPSGEAGASPVIVLTAARSGSTLLRIMLDSHPALGCPEETNIVGICARISRQWRELEGTGADLSRSAAAAIRTMVDTMFASYLERGGKHRWCDKSLGSARPAAEFAKVYPDAVYICLYRHCLDVVDSGIEASMWGARAYGFGPYVARRPDNTVAALTEYWTDATRQILDFEKSHPAMCTRLYYEDLVASPEESMAAIFEFLGEPTVPGITEKCFGDDHGPPGRSDYKVWATHRVSDASVGRGTRVPWGRIPADLRAETNALLAELGYPALGRPYAHVGRLATAYDDDVVLTAEDTALGAVAGVLADRLRDRLTSTPIPQSWIDSVHGRPIKFTVLPHRGRQDPQHWLVDLSPANVTHCVVEPTAGFAWTLRADAASLLSVMAGDLNLAAGLRSGQLRVLPPPPASGQAVTTPTGRPYIRNRILVGLLGPDTSETGEPMSGDFDDAPR